MDAKLTFKYDREGDILYINTQPPYPEQESEELGDGVIAWLNPRPERSKTLRCYSSTRLLPQRPFRTASRV